MVKFAESGIFDYKPSVEQVLVTCEEHPYSLKTKDGLAFVHIFV
jgi:hypothetical protein